MDLSDKIQMMAGCRTNKLTSNAAKSEDEEMWIVTLGLGRWKSEKFMIHKTKQNIF